MHSYSTVHVYSAGKSNSLNHDEFLERLKGDYVQSMRFLKMVHEKPILQEFEFSTNLSMPKSQSKSCLHP